MSGGFHRTWLKSDVFHRIYWSTAEWTPSKNPMPISQATAIPRYTWLIYSLENSGVRGLVLLKQQSHFRLRESVIEKQGPVDSPASWQLSPYRITWREHCVCVGYNCNGNRRLDVDVYGIYVLSFCVFPDGYNSCSVLPNLGSGIFN